MALLYEELIDVMASSCELGGRSSGGIVAAQLTSLNTIWAEFRATFYKEKSEGKQIAFTYSLLSQKYMCIRKIKRFVAREQEEK